MIYSLIRASYRGDLQEGFPRRKGVPALAEGRRPGADAVAAVVKERKIKPDKLDESLRNLVELNDAGMLDCWILISGADDGIAQDYDAYRKEHRQLCTTTLRGLWCTEE